MAKSVVGERPIQVRRLAFVGQAHRSFGIASLGRLLLLEELLKEFALFHVLHAGGYSQSRRITLLIHGIALIVHFLKRAFIILYLSLLVLCTSEWRALIASNCFLFAARLRGSARL